MNKPQAFASIIAILLVFACTSVTNQTTGAAESCSVAASCPSGGDIQVCTTHDPLGVCLTATYRVGLFKSYPCTGCEDCAQAAADVISVCGAGTVLPSVDAGSPVDACVGAACSPPNPGPTGTCVGGGGLCKNGIDCCSNRCVAGVCDPCAAAGAACGTAQCCPNAPAPLTCFHGSCSTCLGGGALCKTTSDCCSQACTGGTCEAAVSPPPPPPPPTCDITQTLPAHVPVVPASCVTIIQASCCDVADSCMKDAGCVTMVQCLLVCGPANQGCRSDCVTNAPSISRLTGNGLASCLTAHGGAPCIP